MTPRVSSPRSPRRAGLGWLPVRTVYEADKIVRLTAGPGPRRHTGARVRDPARAHRAPARMPALARPVPTASDPLGLRDAAGGVLGTTLHGLFEEDAFRSSFLGFVAARRGRVWRPSGASYAAARERQIDRIADACEEHLDTERLWRLLDEGTVSAPARPA